MHRTGADVHWFTEFTIQVNISVCRFSESGGPERHLSAIYGTGKGNRNRNSVFEKEMFASRG